jgi:glucose-1-phosphatase
MEVASPLFIFDLGGVLISHDNELLYDRLAEACSNPKAARSKLVDWPEARDFALGRLNEEGFHARLASDFGFRGDLNAFRERWCCHFGEEPGMTNALRNIATRYRTVLLSNTNVTHWEHIRFRYPVASYVHATYLSFEMGLEKPNVEIYRAVLQGEDRTAGDSIFVDDRTENIDAATALGIRSIAFTGYEPFAATLRAWGVRAD